VRAFVTGGTGFIGRHLVGALLERGAEVAVLSRGNANPWKGDARVRLVRGDPTRAGVWQASVSGCDVVFNLAGMPLVDPPHRWNDTRKAEIRESRVATTEHVVEAMRVARARPAALISQSGKDYYGPRGDTPADETSPPGADFLAGVCLAWETAARQAEDIARVTLLRTAVVLGRNGGALHFMLTPFKLGVGGLWGTGEQWWAWIHMSDMVGLMLFAWDRQLTGPINVAAPQPVTVKEFARELGHALHRPAFARVPEVALRLALGEAADALLASQRVVPARALAAGYQYRFPQLHAALADVVSDQRSRE
jgi:uncharacterized protein (TIGR01777 family)